LRRAKEGQEGNEFITSNDRGVKGQTRQRAAGVPRESEATLDSDGRRFSSQLGGGCVARSTSCPDCGLLPSGLMPNPHYGKTCKGRARVVLMGDGYYGVLSLGAARQLSFPSTRPHSTLAKVARTCRVGWLLKIDSPYSPSAADISCLWGVVCLYMRQGQLSLTAGQAPSFLLLLLSPGHRDTETEVGLCAHTAHKDSPTSEHYTSPHPCTYLGSIEARPWPGVACRQYYVLVRVPSPSLSHSLISKYRQSARRSPPPLCMSSLCCRAIS
jgi:hypothetical protein